MSTLSTIGLVCGMIVCGLVLIVLFGKAREDKGALREAKKDADRVAKSLQDAGQHMARPRPRGEQLLARLRRARKDAKWSVPSDSQRGVRDGVGDEEDA